MTKDQGCRPWSLKIPPLFLLLYVVTAVVTFNLGLLSVLTCELLRSVASDLLR